MDEATLEKLAKNPHYTMSGKQRDELEQLKGKKQYPIEPFNMISKHNNSFDAHETYPKKRSRTV